MENENRLYMVFWKFKSAGGIFSVSLGSPFTLSQVGVMNQVAATILRSDSKYHAS